MTAKRILLIAAGAALIAFAVLAYVRYPLWIHHVLVLVGEEPRAAPGWAYEVFADDLPFVDNIVVAPDGDLYVSLELRAPEGQVYRLRGEERELIAHSLARPDGVALALPYLYVTEEVQAGRLIRIDLTDRTDKALVRLQLPEGISILDDGSLIVTEDVKEGRLLRLNADGKVEQVIARLDRPEGTDLGPDGQIYVAETGTGRVLAFTGDQQRVVVEGLREPDQVAVAPDGALWITEDQLDGRLLRHHDGRLETIMENLTGPQGIAFGANGEIYVAEQLRGRILVLRRDDKAGAD